PVCNAYLTKLEGLTKSYQDAGFSVVAVSMDGKDRAEKAAGEWGLEDLPVAYDLDEKTAREWGLWVSTSFKEGEADVFVEPGLYWVRPDGRLYLIDISNMPWARPDLEFLLSKVPFAVEKGYPARGMRA
ncbi:MAG: redoxin domain-containing protein, partial [Rhizobiales bacterium]|nr:redoxin domain-containing protein [Hyphomicrobiales bacterium]